MKKLVLMSALFLLGCRDKSPAKFVVKTQTQITQDSIEDENFKDLIHTIMMASE